MSDMNRSFAGQMPEFYDRFLVPIMFAPPRPNGRFAFSQETFAGRCSNEKDAPVPGLRRSAPSVQFRCAACG